jgi:hypothetical protein
VCLSLCVRERGGTFLQAQPLEHEPGEPLFVPPPPMMGQPLGADGAGSIVPHVNGATRPADVVTNRVPLQAASSLQSAADAQLMQNVVPSQAAAVASTSLQGVSQQGSAAAQSMPFPANSQACPAPTLAWQQNGVQASMQAPAADGHGKSGIDGCELSGPNLRAATNGEQSAAAGPASNGDDSRTMDARRFDSVDGTRERADLAVPSDRLAAAADGAGREAVLDARNRADVVETTRANSRTNMSGWSVDKDAVSVLERAGRDHVEAAPILRGVYDIFGEAVLTWLPLGELSHVFL